MPSAHERLATLGLALPPAPNPLASYVPTTVVPLGDGRALVTVAGQVMVDDGVPVDHGRVPDEVSLERAAENARGCALRLLAQLDRAAGLDNVEQMVQLTVYIRSADDFEAHPKVANGASDLLLEVLGDRGQHTRVAVGANALPRGVPIELTAQAVVRLPTPERAAPAPRRGSGPARPR